jgi:thiaminase
MSYEFVKNDAIYLNSFTRSYAHCVPHEYSSEKMCVDILCPIEYTETGIAEPEKRYIASNGLVNSAATNTHKTGE